MKQNETEMKSLYQTILSCLSYDLVLLGIIIMVPVAILPFYPEERSYAHSFILPGVLSILVGYLFMILTKGTTSRTLKRNEGSFIVLLIWVVSILVGSTPFLLTGGYTFSQAVFETTSGFTTSGFTMTDVIQASHLLLLYRSTLHLFGGVGLILILSTVLSEVYGMQLFTAEGHNDVVAPSLLHSARTILTIYMSMILSGTILYILFGMSPFDAINHSISAVATGGFSTQADSIGHYNSVPIDIITMILMIMGATNFMSSLMLIRGKFKEFFCHAETLVMTCLIVFFTPIVSVIFIVNHISEDTLHAIDDAAFQVVSSVTTTGLSTVDSTWLTIGASMVPALVLMLVGGNTGSTAGGAKSYRFAMAVKEVYWTFQDLIDTGHLHRQREILRYGYRVSVSPKEQQENNSFLFLYFNIALLGTLGLTACGYDFRDSFYEFISALSTTGISIGLVSRDMPIPAMWIITLGMLIARLEVYIIPLGMYRFGADMAELTRLGKDKIKETSNRKEKIRQRRERLQKLKEAKTDAGQ